ncbi:hypothetical protein AgCh_005990 [Apium graveolens]
MEVCGNCGRYRALHQACSNLGQGRKTGEVLDFQDILQRFAFDNICNIAFDYDPEYLSPSLPKAKFAVAFENATTLVSKRFQHIIPLVWKVQKFFDMVPEKELRKSNEEVGNFAREVMVEKRKEFQEKSELKSVDLLTRFLSSGHSDEVFVTDIIISFILASRDTTSAALTWFFYLIANHPNVESEILAEINDKNFERNSESSVYDEVKDMIYTHAALCESMRLYPPVPTDGKEVMENDVLPEGTHVYKGDRVLYHPYAMGQLEKIWGSDWPVFRPERWLERDSVTGKWCFIGRDQYTYPVFQAGPRVCLGKEMAFLQMKRVVAGVLPMFKVIPVIEKGKKPVFISYLTSKMLGGFPAFCNNLNDASFLDAIIHGSCSIVKDLRSYSVYFVICPKNLEAHAITREGLMHNTVNDKQNIEQSSAEGKSMATTSNHGNQLSQSENYQQFMEELKRKHDSWNVDWDMDPSFPKTSQSFLRLPSSSHHFKEEFGIWNGSEMEW